MKIAHLLFRCPRRGVHVPGLGAGYEPQGEFLLQEAHQGEETQAGGVGLWAPQEIQVLEELSRERKQ